MNLRESLKANERKYNHQFWCEFMSAYNKTLCNLNCIKKKNLKIFLEGQKTTIKGKQDHLFPTTNTDHLLPSLQAYNKAEVKEYVLLAFYKET